MYKLPDFYLVGATKAGTTAICNALANHPGICFSEKKEPNFFSSYDMQTKVIPEEDFFRYTQLFRNHEKGNVMGEGSVTYLDSPNALHWIKKYTPSAKIVIVLRNPIKRIVSLYEMYSRLGIMKKSQKDAFNTDSYLVRQCLIYERVMRYVEAFSSDNVFIMIFDDFVEDSGREFRRLCQFLEVQEDVDMNLLHRNIGGVPKYRALGLLSNRSLIKIAKELLPKSLHGHIDKTIKTLFFKKLRLASLQKEELKKAFHDDVAMLGMLVNRDLCHLWNI